MSKTVRKILQSGPQLFSRLNPSAFGRATVGASATAEPFPEKRQRAWQIASYGELDKLTLVDDAPVPIIRSPSEVLVKVNASSVNPIDVAMTKGYGAPVLNLLRCGETELPLILGRDFSGEVVHKGLEVDDKELRLGAKVWGVLPVHRQGAHAEYVVVDKCYVAEQPAKLSDVHAASVLYAGLTAWSGLYITGHLGGVLGAISSQGGGRGKRVLVLGASGGVGSIATQILVAEGASLVATCAADAVALVMNLGVPEVIDYRDPNAGNDLVAAGPYDLILDCAGKGPAYAAEVPWHFRSYVTFSSPLLRNVDTFGMPGGMIRNAMDLVQSNVKSVGSQRGLVKWAYFVPAPQGIKYLGLLAEREKLLPLIQDTFSFHHANEAYKRVSEGHLRGKIVIDYAKETKPVEPGAHAQ